MLTINVRSWDLAPRRSGKDGMTASGTTGAHPRNASPQLDGPGIRDAGITTIMSSRIIGIFGINSRAINEFYYF